MPPTAISTSMDLNSLLSNLPDLTLNDRKLIERAYHKAEAAHAGQFRKSGEPYFTHCVAVASVLAEMKLDAEAIAAALMHDIVEDTSITLDDVRIEFGAMIAKLVDGMTKLKNLPINVDKGQSGKRPRDANRESEYIRKILMTIGDDVRVALIKLADRLHNMRTLGYMAPERQKQIARETMEIFAPLASRLGIWQIKWELEDLSFRYLEPDAYKLIASSIDELRGDREKYMSEVASLLRQELAKYGIENAIITWRPKHIYSIYRKMQRKQLPFEEIYDIRAIRVIVDTVPQCYLALGVVHNLWRPIVQEFDDYIAAPKDNFYQSLHTAVIDSKGKTVEVQIRTRDMHEHAEYGVAAHWRYKEGNRNSNDEKFQQRLNYIRRLMEFGQDVKDDPEAFIDTMKTEVFQDRVYVYTPKGDIYDLPMGSTPIDFAYHIHTEIGHRCRGAKVQGRLVSLNYQLKTGDQVEILTSKRGGPSMDWLNPDLGYVKTSRASSKIRQWFRKLNRDKHISLGRDVLERELKRMGVLDSMSFDSVSNLFEYAKLEDFLAAVGAGDINGAQIAHRVLDEERKKQKTEDIGSVFKTRPRSSSVVEGKNGVLIQGTGGLLVSLAKCCSPMFGDPIVGFVTRGRGVTVHRRDCANILSSSETERMIDVTWGGMTEEQRYSVPVEIIAYDREGLMRDISTVIADEKVNISEVRVSTRQDIATFHLTMEISSNHQLTRILSKLEQVRSVSEAYRCNQG